MKPQMQNASPKLLDVVALLEDKPEGKVTRGQVGTVVEILAPDVFEVEFCNLNGLTTCLAELHRKELLVLLHEPAMAA